MSFADPYRTVPEAARLLRPGGLLAFSAESPLHFICWDEERDAIGTTLRADYFERTQWDDGQSVCFSLPYGEIELRPPVGATSTYNEFVTYEWARRWPAEHLWRVLQSVL